MAHEFPARVSLSLLCAALVASCADKPRAFSCRAPAGVSVVRYQDVPRPVSLALSLHGHFVLPNEPFDPTDVVETGNDRRLIFVWSRASRWVVATEHGGVGYSNPIFAFDLSADRQDATLVEERVVFPETVCSTATDLLTAAPAP
jgi:hypothetical protein